MIKLTRYDGTAFYLNSDVILYVEATPDTILTLDTRDKVMVRESVEEVIERVIEFKRKVFRGDLEFKRDPNLDAIE